jgi:hypothetical protein
VEDRCRELFWPPQHIKSILMRQAFAIHCRIWVFRCHIARRWPIASLECEAVFGFSGAMPIARKPDAMLSGAEGFDKSSRFRAKGPHQVAGTADRATLKRADACSPNGPVIKGREFVLED